MRVTGLLALLAPGALVALAACNGLPFEPAGPDSAPDPSTFGPYPVGVRTVELFDASRTTKGKEGPRRITVEIWYPAVNQADDAPRVTYALADQLPDDVHMKLGTSNAGLIPTVAVRDARARRDDAPYPLVLFSHGSGGVRMQSTHLTVALASHGYVVAAPDHEGNTLADVLHDDGIDLEKLFDSVLDRPLDLDFATHYLANLPDDDAIGKLVDLDRIGVAGHSFGATTALREAGFNPRIKAVVSQAPAGYLISWIDVPRPLEELGIPIMIHAGKQDMSVPPETNARTIWDHTRAPRYYLSFERAGHFTFSDLCLLDTEALVAADAAGIESALDDGCGEEFLPPEQAFAIIRHHAIGFFNGYLRGSPGSLALLAPNVLPGTADEITLEVDR